MPGRSYNTGDYRYGFIGAENDNEVAGTGNTQNHMFRSYDTRLGRYKSLDPLFRDCLLYTSPSPRDLSTSRMPSSA